MTMNFKRATWACEKVVITPDLARLMLATSISNRRLRSWWVDLCAEMLRRGQWLFTHQGIAFDCNGALRDGHHRLNAIVRAGLPMTLTVTLGLDPESCVVYDTGIARTMADLTKLDHRIVEVARLGATIVMSKPKVNAAQVLEIGDGGLLPAAEALIKHCGGSARYYSSAPMRLAACVMLMSRASTTSYVLEQYRALCTLNTDEMSPIAKGLQKQVQRAHVGRAADTKETLARGMRVFDHKRRNATAVQVSLADIAASWSRAKGVLMDSIDETEHEDPSTQAASSTIPAWREKLRARQEATP